MNILLFVYQVVAEFVKSNLFASFFYIVFAFGILIIIINFIRRVITNV